MAITRRPGTLEAMAAANIASDGTDTPPAPGLVLDVSVEACVNYGRWIARCPFDGCAGAEFVDPDDQRFFCTECRNAGAGGSPVPVTFPDAVPAIESVLTVRPLENRNWEPGEAVEDLRAENAERDLPTGEES